MAMRRRGSWLAAGLVVMSLIVISCGSADVGSNGPGAPGGSQGSTASEGAGAGQPAGGPAGMSDLGLPLAAGLLPELASVPVPDGVGFIKGTAYTKDQDPRQTAVQDLYSDRSVDDLVAFYEQALPAAGFQITGTESGQQTFIQFVDPASYEGQVIVGTSAIGPPTQIHIESYRYRTVDQ